MSENQDAENGESASYILPPQLFKIQRAETQRVVSFIRKSVRHYADNLSCALSRRLTLKTMPKTSWTLLIFMFFIRRTRVFLFPNEEILVIREIRGEIVRR